MTSQTLVAVVGTYRCGSSIVAEMLHNLGVDMGAPFYGDFYEPSDLATWLRRCWNEPQLTSTESQSSRVAYLRNCIASRGNRGKVGCKHPLLSLLLDDIVDAWGAETKFVWCRRPIDDSVLALEKMNWWPNERTIQEKLFSNLEKFFPRAKGLVIDFEDSTDRPHEVVERLIDFLELSPSGQEVANAVKVVKKSYGKSKKTNSFPRKRTRELTQILDPPKVIGTLLCGNNDTVVGDAVRSVINFVDRLIMIDTGSSDKSKEIVSDIAGKKLQVRSIEWKDDFANARNKALDFAIEMNARWALTIDTDERIDFGAIKDSRELLNRLDSSEVAQAWMVVSQSGNYEKERFVRLPTSLRWKGRTHEALCGARPNGRPRLMGIKFREHPKTDDQFAHKLNRDLQILREELRADPNNGRNWYYLGQTLLGSKQFEGAIAAFDRCASIRDWDELSAWACYRAAKCLADCFRFEEAIERCVIGLAIDPLYPELSWMNAWCCLQLKQYRRAVCWAKMSVSIGATMDENALDQRIGFRDVIGWYEGPHEILCAAFHYLGEHKSTGIAKEALAEAKGKRAKKFDLFSDATQVSNKPDSSPNPSL